MSNHGQKRGREEDGDGGNERDKRIRVDQNLMEEMFARASEFEEIRAQEEQRFRQTVNYANMSSGAGPSNAPPQDFPLLDAYAEDFNETYPLAFPPSPTAQPAPNTAPPPLAQTADAPGATLHGVLPATKVAPGADAKSAITGTIYLGMPQLQGENPFKWRDRSLLIAKNQKTTPAEARELMEEYDKYLHRKYPKNCLQNEHGFQHHSRQNLSSHLRKCQNEAPVPYTLREDIDLVRYLHVLDNPRFFNIAPANRVTEKVKDICVTWDRFRTERSIFKRAQKLAKLFARLRQIYGHDDSEDELGEVESVDAFPREVKHLTADTVNRLREVGEFFGQGSTDILRAEYDKEQSYEFRRNTTWPARLAIFEVSPLPFSTQEDMILIEWHRVAPNDWELIADQLPYRIPKSVERRFGELQRAYQILSSLRAQGASGLPGQGSNPGPSNPNTLF